MTLCKSKISYMVAVVSALSTEDLLRVCWKPGGHWGYGGITTKIGRAADGGTAAAIEDGATGLGMGAGSGADAGMGLCSKEDEGEDDDGGEDDGEEDDGREDDSGEDDRGKNDGEEGVEERTGLV